MSEYSKSVANVKAVCLCSDPVDSGHACLTFALVPGEPAGEETWHIT